MNTTKAGNNDRASHNMKVPVGFIPGIDMRKTRVQTWVWDLSAKIVRRGSVRDVQVEGIRCYISLPRNFIGAISLLSMQGDNPRDGICVWYDMVGMENVDQNILESFPSVIGNDVWWCRARMPGRATALKVTRINTVMDLIHATVAEYPIIKRNHLMVDDGDVQEDGSRTFNTVIEGGVAVHLVVLNKDGEIELDQEFPLGLGFAKMMRSLKEVKAPAPSATPAPSTTPAPPLHDSKPLQQGQNHHRRNKTVSSGHNGHGTRSVDMGLIWEERNRCSLDQPGGRRSGEMGHNDPGDGRPVSRTIEQLRTVGCT